MRSYDKKIAVLLWMLALGLAGSPLVAQNTAIPNDWLRVTVCELLRAPEQYLGKDVEVGSNSIFQRSRRAERPPPLTVDYRLSALHDV
jgi:hypothetical protein